MVAGSPRSLRVLVSLCLFTFFLAAAAAATGVRAEELTTNTTSIFLDFVSSDESGKMIEESSVTNVLDTVKDFIQSGLPISPPCVRALEDTTIGCEVEVEEIMRNVHKVKKELQLVRGALALDNEENNSFKWSVSRLMSAVQNELQWTKIRQTNSFDGKVGIGSETTTRRSVGRTHPEENIPLSDPFGSLPIDIDPTTGDVIVDEKTRVVNAAIQLGRRIQDVLYKGKQYNTNTTTSFDFDPPSLEEIILGGSFSSLNALRDDDDDDDNDGMSLGTPSLFELFAGQAVVGKSCCQAVDKLLRYSTCLCDKGVFGSVLQSKWVDMTERMKRAVKEAANTQCKGIAALPDNLEEVRELRTLDETKVCKCRSLLATISESKSSSIAENENGSHSNDDAQMVQSFSGAQPTQFPLLRSRNQGLPVQVDKVLQFDSLNEASRFFTEQRITAFDADKDTADLIRSTCL
jgi:hypothetical protein